MTQIISHWFYTLDLNNQTFQRKFLEELAFTLLHQVLRVGVVIVYMSVCAWCVYLTSGHEQEPENALRRDRWFSHMGNSVWLHWGARMHLNKQCTVLSQAMSSINDITLCCGTGCCSVCDAHCGSPWEAWWMRKLCSPLQNKKRIFPMNIFWTVNNVHTFHMNTHIIGPTVVWPEGGVCCVACQTLWYFLQRSDPISRVLLRAASQMAQLGLGQWQWHREAVDSWHTAVTNCEEKVRGICSGFIHKDMEIQPPSPGYGLAKMKSLNHEYSEGGTAIYCSQSCFYGSNIGGQW